MGLFTIAVCFCLSVVLTWVCQLLISLGTVTYFAVLTGWFCVLFYCSNQAAEWWTNTKVEKWDDIIASLDLTPGDLMQDTRNMFYMKSLQTYNAQNASAPDQQTNSDVFNSNIAL